MNFYAFWIFAFAAVVSAQQRPPPPPPPPGGLGPGRERQPPFSPPSGFGPERQPPFSPPSGFGPERPPPPPSSPGFGPGPLPTSTRCTASPAEGVVRDTTLKEFNKFMTDQAKLFEITYRPLEIPKGELFQAFDEHMKGQGISLKDVEQLWCKFGAKIELLSGNSNAVNQAKVTQQINEFPIEQQPKTFLLNSVQVCSDELTRDPDSCNMGIYYKCLSRKCEEQMTRNPGQNNPGQNNPGQNNFGQNTPGQNNSGPNNPGQNNFGQNPGQNNFGQNNPGQNNFGQNNPGQNSTGQNNSGQGFPFQNNSGQNNQGTNGQFRG